ncbi:hypothetical protein GCM10009839_47230 [Catenulispora yoronensis]|uniref:Uncharacterized protein n=1 Tax=Catenulispora yoronensis TaxID=450799 RepID=A0ABN2UN42_9ACTN
MPTIVDSPQVSRSGTSTSLPLVYGLCDGSTTSFGRTVTFAGSGGAVAPEEPGGLAAPVAVAPGTPGAAVAGAVAAEEGHTAAEIAAASAAPASRPLSATTVSRREGRKITVPG